MQPSLCPESADALFSGLSKQIDAAFGLCLREDHQDILNHLRLISINPAKNFTTLVPRYLLIEVKRPYQNKDPMIQLGIWAGAEFTKWRCEGWSLDMPLLAIEINGDDWALYLVYARPNEVSASESGFKVVFVGPQKMGWTNNHLGIYQILDWLIRCNKWGLEQYRTWFEREVLKLKVKVGKT